MRVVIVAAVATLCAGCAMSIRGFSQPVRFETEPPDGTVAVTNSTPGTCQAPCVLNVHHSRTPQEVKIQMQGRETYSGEMISVDDGSMPEIGMALIDGLLIIPGIIDLSQGLLRNYPERIHAILPPEGRGTARVESFRSRR